MLDNFFSESHSANWLAWAAGWLMTASGWICVYEMTVFCPRV